MYPFDDIPKVCPYVTDARQGKCFVNLDGKNQCIEPLSINLSKMDCCCGRNMGKGWGDTCEKCPPTSSGTHPLSCFVYHVIQMKILHRLDYIIQRIMQCCAWVVVHLMYPFPHWLTNVDYVLESAVVANALMSPKDSFVIATLVIRSRKVAMHKCVKASS